MLRFELLRVHEGFRILALANPSGKGSSKWLTEELMVSCWPFGFILCCSFICDVCAVNPLFHGHSNAVAAAISHSNVSKQSRVTDSKPQLHEATTRQQPSCEDPLPTISHLQQQQQIADRQQSIMLAAFCFKFARENQRTTRNNYEFQSPSF